MGLSGAATHQWHLMAAKCAEPLLPQKAETATVAVQHLLRENSRPLRLLFGPQHVGLQDHLPSPIRTRPGHHGRMIPHTLSCSVRTVQRSHARAHWDPQGHERALYHANITFQHVLFCIHAIIAWL